MAASVKLVRLVVDFENQTTEHVVRYTKSTPFGDFEEDTTVRVDGVANVDATAVATALATTMASGKRASAKPPQLATVDLPAVVTAPATPGAPAGP